MVGAHGGMHQKWHNAYEETIHIPFIVSSPLFKGGRREADIPTSHADLLPTLLGLAGIDQRRSAQARCCRPYRSAPSRGPRPLGRHSAAPIAPAARSCPLRHRRRDQRGQREAQQPVPALGPQAGDVRTVVQPNHIETIVARLTSTASSISSSFRATTTTSNSGRCPANATSGSDGEEDRHGDRADPGRVRALRPHPRPPGQHNLAHPRNADDRSRKLQERMLRLLVEQLAAKRLVPRSGGRPGYRPPVTK